MKPDDEGLSDYEDEDSQGEDYESDILSTSIAANQENLTDKISKVKK